MDGLKASTKEMYAAGLAFVMTDIAANKNIFWFHGGKRMEEYELPRGSVRIAEWRGRLVTPIDEVREAARRANGQ